MAQVAHIFEEVHEDRISYDTFLKICRAEHAPPPGKDSPTSTCDHHPHQIRKRRRSSIKSVLPLETVPEAQAGPEVVTPKET